MTRYVYQIECSDQDPRETLDPPPFEDLQEAAEMAAILDMLTKGTDHEHTHKVVWVKDG